MPKANKPGSHKPGENKSKKPTMETLRGVASNPPKIQANPPIADKSKQGSKSSRPAIGGTAIPGAKSTQPKEMNATTPTQQQAESYNRVMRRRMEHLGTGPYSENPTVTAREKRQKRIERKKQHRLEEVQKTVARSPRPNTALGRRNTIFLIAVVAILVLIIVVFILIRHPF